VKYKYCPRCDKAYIKSRLEKDSCIYCGGPCETVDVKRNGMYYLGYAIMLAGAASAFVPRFVVVSAPELFIAAGIGLVVGGSVIIIMANGAMTNMAKEKAMEDDTAPE
ncbi:MAG: hypothetical protein KKD98_03275, partial [Candidatus Thermoplasmatota archaeon]|nr:hypothetical protein [Candidatus Thermoplasmatota archaeon]